MSCGGSAAVAPSRLVHDPKSQDPAWSSDGQRIAFTHYDQTGDQLDYNGTSYAAVAGSAGTEMPTAAAACKPRGQSDDTTAEFPLPDWAPIRGTVRVAVLFVDFPDAQADHTTEEEAAQGLPWAEEYLEYTVDTLIGSGQLSIKVAGERGNGQVEGFPVLQEGESVTVRGVTVTVTGDDGDTHTVTIARNT